MRDTSILNVERVEDLLMRRREAMRDDNVEAQLLIAQELSALEVTVQDGPQGVRWWWNRLP